MCRPGHVTGLPMLLLLLLVTVSEVVDSNRCLTTLKEVNPKRVVHLDGRPLNIQFEVSRRITQRLASRVMRIFLVEVLGYPGVALLEKEDKFDTGEAFARLSETLTYTGKRIIPETMVNMEVWIPAREDTTPLLNRYHVKECGSVAPPAHFGWFVPEGLFRPEDDSWLTFTKRETAARFDVDEANLGLVESLTVSLPESKAPRYYCRESFCERGMYVPRQCRQRSEPCALLLAGHSDVTGFVRDHIDELKLYVRVAWVGPNLKNLTELLTKEYLPRTARNRTESRSLVILDWTPGNAIPNERKFASIGLPRCYAGGTGIGCRYESNRLVKLAWARLESVAKFAYEAIKRAKFTLGMYQDLIERYNGLSSTRSEDDIACDWLRDNLNYTLSEWMPNDADRSTLIIGGIFPMTGSSYTAKSIVIAAKLAKEAINVNDTVLRDYDLTLLASDGQCRSDTVMKSFIDYIVHNRYDKLIGVLGPACSETVEPLVGVSKHYRTVVISYSAEGSSFDDRTKYPYFFRTIGENKQYEHVYLCLLKRLGWHRVAALTEDGQRYTEYISYMRDTLQDNGITFIANVKFPRTRGSDVMSRYLQDLKRKRARIIIADVYDQVARQVMCEARRLEMTAAQGYVWFLPLWLLPRWYDTDLYNERGEQVPCTTAQMVLAVNGYFGLSHANFAPDDAVMQEGITVRQWRDRYEGLCARQHQPPSSYAGYAYDAMWTYAYAMDRLIKENQSYAFDLHSDRTVDRLTAIIRETDFDGVSGRIKFLGGPSRVSVVTIVQHVDNETRIVGNFHPNVSERTNEVVGGTLDLNMSAIVWLSKEVPNDGSEPPRRCVLAGLADLLDVSCEVAIVTANIIGFGLLGAFLVVGFVVVKRKYDEKVRLHERYIKSLGIDLLQSDASGLDKWEIPRDRVVINRKLGEGAFGTVYGGEAFFPERGWLAVAVKTLKLGSSTDEKLDFLSEVEVMKRFEHKNIVKLLAVCIKCEPVLTVMEFMLYGDLKTYLLARRHLVNDQNYEDSEEISNKKLTAMALDVARALGYLAQLKYVHRDVASRNCLVNAQRVVKLGDFGMTRPMYENDYYKFNRKGMLPVRWMAPESLGLGIFTPASDVWSYGVLLYEIVTFGSFPFQGLSNNQVLTHVKAGNALTVPKGVKPQLESLIRSCWHVDHKKRPTAPEIVDFLATNPRILCPCLDVPLASVQLEYTGQIEMQLPENFRKFSISLAKIQQRTPGLVSLDSLNPPLLDIANRENSCNLDRLLGVRAFEPESSRPLLGSSQRTATTNTTAAASAAAATRYVELQQTCNGRNKDNDDLPRYVNLHPKNSVSSASTTTGNIELEERDSFLTEGHDRRDIPFL